MKINLAMRKQMEADIRACDNQVGASGSQRLHDELIARYSAFDTAFTDRLPEYSSYVLRRGSDYRPALKDIAAQLRAYLLTVETVDSTTNIRDVVVEFIQRGGRIRENTLGPVGVDRSFGFLSMKRTPYGVWMSEINTFNERYLKSHPLYSSIHSAYVLRRNRHSSYANMMAHLIALANDHEFWNEKWQEEFEMPKKMAVIKKEPNSATR